MSRPLPRLAQLLAIATLALLAACAQPFEARVQSFQAMPPVQGQTFHITPADADRAGSLEFAAYAGLVGTELQKLGFRPAASAETADIQVMVGFSSGPGRERISTRPSTNPSWGWHGGWYGGWGRGWYGRPGWWGPWYDPWSPWGGQEVYSFTVYPAYLHVAMVRTADKTPVFEGRAETTTRKNDLPTIMPNLVTALFTDFPGEPARSKVVRVPAPR